VHELVAHLYDNPVIRDGVPTAPGWRFGRGGSSGRGPVRGERLDLPIRDLQRYVELVNEGPHTAPERLALMESHREAVRRRQAELAAALAVIEFKITAYGGTCGA
jgi:hypothetical protein